MGNLCSGGAAKQAKKEAAEENMIYEKKPKDENAPSEHQTQGATGDAATEAQATVEDSPTKSIAEKNAETRESWMAGAQKLIDESATREIQAKSQRIHESLAQKAKQAEQDIAETGEEIKTEITETGEKLKADASAKVDEIQEDLTQAAKETVEKVKTEASEKSEEIQASIGGFFKDITDQGKSAASEAAVAVEDVKIGVEEEAAKTTEKVESVTESASSQVAEKIDNVKEAAVAGVQQVEGKIDEASQQIVSKGEEIKSEANELKTSAETAIAQQTQNVENQFKEMAKSAEDKMESLSSDVASKKEKVEANVAAAQEEVKTVVNTQKENLENIASDASKQMEDCKQEINTASKDIQASVEQNVKDVTETVGSEIDDKSKIIESSVDKVSNEVSESGNAFTQIGENAAKSVSESAQNIVTDIKSALHDGADSCEKNLNENISAAEQTAADILPPPYSGDEYKFDQIIDDLDKSKPAAFLADTVGNLSSEGTPASIDRQNSELANVQREQIEVKRQNEFKVSAEDFMGDIPSELPPPPPPPPEYIQNDPLVENLVSDLIEAAKSSVTSDFQGSSVDAEPSSDDLPAPSAELMDFSDNTAASRGPKDTLSSSIDEQEKSSVSGESQVSMGESDDNLIEHIASQVTTQVVEEAMKIVAADGGNNPGSDHSEGDMSGSMSSTSPTESLQSPVDNKELVPSADGNLSDVQKLQQLADQASSAGSPVDCASPVVNNVDTKGASPQDNVPHVNGNMEHTPETVGKSPDQDIAVSSYSTPVDVQKEAII